MIDIYLEKAFAEALLIKTTTFESSEEWEIYQADARTDPEKAFVVEVQEPLLWVYLSESQNKNAKAFIRVVKKYYQRWCEDKLRFQIPDEDIVTAEIAVYDKGGIANKPMNITKARNYCKWIIKRNQLDKERPHLFSPIKRRRLRKSR
ncbi:uncharacterized protein J8A68_004157 [[Candida] subhashii]|uniref:Uncharacterized protein n=1 Tax=[Candida] subhashii TaxID=561895 RepID=A0A8J5UKW5_9ASCO|nr:uncharacterized protein J8A68_004157 [[Candida] subhashii]KAG7662386.1 hypothetical protein J8A68_004157 [[Candida] subhashii]